MADARDDADALEPNAISGAFRGQVRETVASVELEGNIVVYDEERGVVHCLNPTAAATFSCLDGTVTLDEVVEELAKAYAVCPEAIHGDVLGIVREFGAKNLLRGIEPASADALNLVEVEGEA